MSVPTTRFYKVLTITNTLMLLLGISGSTLCYYLGVAQGETKCELEGSNVVIEQQHRDSEIINEELDSFISNPAYDYLLFK